MRVKQVLLFFLFFFFLLKFSFSQNIVSNFANLTPKQLLDTADYFFLKNHNDTALACYSLFINTSQNNTDPEQQKRIVEAYTKSSMIYFYICDFSKSYELLIKALHLCEKCNYKSYQSKIYTNIGNIYYRFKKFNFAKFYYSEALRICQDSIVTVILLNNLGATEIENNCMDSSFFFLNKSLQISQHHNNVYIEIILNSLAQAFSKIKNSDSAFYYFRLSLNESRKNNKIEMESNNLSGLSKLFFELNKIDSAKHYINLSNKIAFEKNFLRILAENFLTLSKIEKSKGNIYNAFEYYQKYADLNDSIYNVEKYGEINQLQRLYEVSKTNQQIEQLVIEQQIKARTIHYLRIILIVLLITSGTVLGLFFQKRKLVNAYKALFEKNLEIIELKENSSESNPQKSKKSALPKNIQEELLAKILTVMEDSSIISDPKFSINTLAWLVNSNYTYISQVINDAYKKNFRSFLNSYRIQEVQRIFSKPESAKFTIESIAIQVGFNTQSAFRKAFIEVTGVSPYFYFKSIQKEQGGEK